MAVFLIVVIVLGYVVIWAIWHFFFREAGDHVPGERPATVPQKPHDSLTATPRATQALGRAIGDGDASTGSTASNDAPADASDVPRVTRHSASSSEDDRQP